MVTVERIDPETAPEAVLAELAGFYRWVEADELPDDPPTPPARLILNWRNIGSHESVVRWAARREGGIVGAAVTWIGHADNLDRGYGRLWVHPEHRGEGIGRTLAAAVLDYLGSEGRTRIDTYIVAGRPEEALLERLGMERVYEETRNRLRVADVDLALMEEWVARAPDRASDYHLVELTEPFPEEALAPWCELQFQMNTAPREGFEVDDEVMTPEMWRDTEARQGPARRTLRTVVAVHRPSGAFAGSSTLQVDLLDPTRAQQWETVTHPHHRNRGLGRWMKAANLLRVVDEFGVERVDTENAGSNEPMLAINRAMGFRTVLVTHAYDGDLQPIRDRLGA